MICGDLDPTYCCWRSWFSGRLMALWQHSDGVRVRFQSVYEAVFFAFHIFLFFLCPLTQSFRVCSIADGF